MYAYDIASDINPFDISMDKALKWVHSIDRTPLGTFAVQDRKLAYVYALAVLQVAESTLDNLYNAMSYSDDTPEVAASIAMNELTFWNRRGFIDNPYPLIHSAKKSTPERNAAVRRLDTVYNHPDAHDYFAAGIWDIPFVESCIESGIDVEIAYAMSVSAP